MLFLGSLYLQQAVGGTPLRAGLGFVPMALAGAAAARLLGHRSTMLAAAGLGASAASSAGKKLSTRSSCAVTSCGVSTVVTMEKCPGSSRPSGSPAWAASPNCSPTAAPCGPASRVEEARDVLWTLNAHSVHDLLVVERGWSPERYRDWLADTLARALLPDEQPGPTR